MWFSYEWLNRSILCQMPKPIVLTLPSLQPSCAASQMHRALLRAQAPFSLLPVWQCQASWGKHRFCSRRAAEEASSMVQGSSCCLGSWGWNGELMGMGMQCSPEEPLQLSVSPELLPSRGVSPAASLIWNSASALTWNQVDYFSFCSTFAHWSASLWVKVDFQCPKSSWKPCPRCFVAVCRGAAPTPSSAAAARSTFCHALTALFNQGVFASWWNISLSFRVISCDSWMSVCLITSRFSTMI